jgi:PPM family protein phosphatase
MQIANTAVIVTGEVAANTVMTETPTSIIHVAALSSQGNFREDNQDAVRVYNHDDPLNHTHGYLCAIADGMGGYAHGGVASTLALETVFNTIYSNAATNTDNALKRAVNDANLAVYQRAHQMKAGRMGTTLTAVNIVGDQMHIAHVGDSRAYLIRDGKARLLTNDHTMVGELVRMKVLTPDKIRHHAQRSQLNKCLGFDLFIQPDVTKVTIEAGDMVILCTDGVWSVIEDDEFGPIGGHGAANTTALESTAQQLLDLALTRETDDNVSVVAVFAEKLTSKPSSATKSWGIIPKLLKGRFSDKS